MPDVMQDTSIECLPPMSYIGPQSLTHNSIISIMKSLGRHGSATRKSAAIFTAIDLSKTQPQKSHFADPKGSFP